MNKMETNFMSFENLSKLIEEHKKETHPYKEYSFDSTSYMLLLIDIGKLQQENKQLKEDIKNIIKILNKNCDDLEATEEEFDSLDRWQNE